MGDGNTSAEIGRFAPAASMEAIERVMDCEGADANAQEGEAPRLGLVQHGAAWVKGTLPAGTEWWSKVAATSQRFEGAPYDAEPES